MTAKTSKPSSARLPAGFTLIELLTVIAIIAILAAILVPVVGTVRENARRAACSSNVRQICLATLMYANDHHERLPVVTMGFWPWDIDRNLMELFVSYAGDDRNMFYCPSARVDPIEMWSGRADYVVTTYVVLVEGARRVLPDYTNKTIGEPPPIRVGRDEFVEIPITQRELVVDAVLSSSPAGTEFRIVSSTPGVAFRYANHMESETMAAGGNVGFLDGSVRWRPVSEMSPHRTTGTPPFWW